MDLLSSKRRLCFCVKDCLGVYELLVSNVKIGVRANSFRGSAIRSVSGA